MAALLLKSSRTDQRCAVEIVDSLGLEVLPHPPYSPDLAPSDYRLFGLMKKCWVNRNLPQIWMGHGPFISGLHSCRLRFLHRAFTNLLKDVKMGQMFKKNLEDMLKNESTMPTEFTFEFLNR